MLKFAPILFFVAKQNLLNIKVFYVKKGNMRDKEIPVSQQDQLMF